MTSKEILASYIAYFEKHDHKLIPNLSLVPGGDSTLLFVNSGMFPLVPYLSGEPHPLGKRLVNVQRAIRFEDLDDIGDNRHTTAFHMLGNWSLGDYFKSEQLPLVYDWLVNELKLDPKKLFATVFAGDERAPRDDASIKILKEIFQGFGIDATEGERIFAYADNWWQRGEAVGELGGPDSEIFYYTGVGSGVGKNLAGFQDEFIEIGNSVFMQYRKTETNWEELPQKNVDFGGGLERITMVVQGKSDIFETDNFWPIIEKIQALSNHQYLATESVTRSMRVLADHVRTATFLAMDGVVPGNKDQGYVLRRFLRRMVRFGRELGIDKDISASLVPTVAEMFTGQYSHLAEQVETINTTFSEEEEKFRKTLLGAAREVERRLVSFNGSVTELSNMAFNLYQSLGYPPEMLLEDARTKGQNVDEKEFMQLYRNHFAKHQEGSRAGAEQKFKGGLADHSEQVVKYHTATHLLHWALRQVLGSDVLQRGSNITGERLRFDFNYPDKLTDEQIVQVENLVNEKIAVQIPVNFVMLNKDEAEKSGAIHAFGEKYPEQVKVYFIGDLLETAFSKEFCGGPHVSNTGEIGALKVYKQEAVGKGIRRIYARCVPNVVT